MSKLLILCHAFIPPLLRSKSHFQLISLQTKELPEEKLFAQFLEIVKDPEISYLLF